MAQAQDLCATASALTALSLYFRGVNWGRIKSTDLKRSNTGFPPALCTLMWLTLLECITSILEVTAQDTLGLA